jgi:DNA-binding MarR family transcriptional regulator
MTPEQAQVLWYVTATTGFTQDIADAMLLGGLPTMGILLRLQDKGLVTHSYNLSDKCYQWRLTEAGLKEHERRLDEARRRQ